MKRMLFALVVCAAVGLSVPGSSAQAPQPQRPATPAPTADPYATNPNPGATNFPLAATAGKDSGAKQAAPPGATNQGAFDPAKWKCDTAFNAPPGSSVTR